MPLKIEKRIIQIEQILNGPYTGSFNVREGETCASLLTIGEAFEALSFVLYGKQAMPYTRGREPGVARCTACGHEFFENSHWHPSTRDECPECGVLALIPDLREPASMVQAG